MVALWPHIAYCGSVCSSLILVMICVFVDFIFIEFSLVSCFTCIHFVMSVLLIRFLFQCMGICAPFSNINSKDNKEEEYSGLPCK